MSLKVSVVTLPHTVCDLFFDISFVSHIDT